MKKVLLIITGAMAFAVSAYAQDVAPSPTPQRTLSPAGATSASADLLPNGAPTPEFIKTFITQYQNPSRATESMSFSSRFSVAPMTATERKRFESSGKIPFRLTADFYKATTAANGRITQNRITSGTASIVILDEEGNVVKRASSVKIDSLCPS